MNTEPIGYDTAAETLMPHWAKQLAWLRAGSPQNPYPYEVLDCRAACAAFSSSIQKETGSAALAGIETIAAASQDVAVPADVLSSRCAIVIPATQSAIDNLATIGSGDRWLLTTIGSRILVRRRWTGQVVHSAEFTAKCAGFVIEHVVSDRQSSYDSTDYALAELDFILSSCMARTSLAFPIPPQFDRNDMARIALYGWQTHGPLAQFGRLLHSSK